MRFGKYRLESSPDGRDGVTMTSGSGVSASGVDSAPSVWGEVMVKWRPREAGEVGGGVNSPSMERGVIVETGRSRTDGKDLLLFGRRSETSDS